MKKMNFKSYAFGAATILIAFAVLAVTLSDGNFVTTQFQFSTSPNRMSFKAGALTTNVQQRLDDSLGSSIYDFSALNGYLGYSNITHGGGFPVWRLSYNGAVTEDQVTVNAYSVFSQKVSGTQPVVEIQAIGSGGSGELLLMRTGGVKMAWIDNSGIYNGNGGGLTNLLITNVNPSQLTGGLRTTGSWFSASLGLPPTLQGVYSNGVLTSFVDTKLIAVDDFENYPSGLLSAASATNGYGWNGAATTLANGVIGNDSTFHTSYPDKYLQLTNGEYIRKLAVGTNWRYLKIGMLCSIATNGTANITTSYWAMGVCSSVGGGIGTHFTTQNTSNFYGYISSSNETNGDTQTYTAGTGYPYYVNNASNGKVMSWRAQSATNNSTVTWANRPAIPIVNTGRRNWIFVTFDKDAAGANDIVGMCTDANQDVAPTRISLFFNGTTTANQVNLDSGKFVRGTYTLNQMTDSNGALDSINIYWNNSTFPLYIYGIYVQVVPD